MSSSEEVYDTCTWGSLRSGREAKVQIWCVRVHGIVQYMVIHGVVRMVRRGRSWRAGAGRAGVTARGGGNNLGGFLQAR